MGPLSGWMVRSMEARLGVRLEYLRTLVAERPGVLRRLGLFLAAAAPRSGAPARAVHLAGIGATVALDCGECVQIAVNVASAGGVPAELLRAVIDGRLDELDEEDRAAVAFGQAATRNDPSVEALRATLAARYGAGGAHELALAVAFAQFFPVLKRGMGVARSCARVTIDVKAA